jgi:hypothetical protein
MGDGVEPRGRRHARRQPQRQVNVVNDGLGLDRGRAARGLHAILRLAEDVGHLGAGIGGRHDDLRQVGIHGDGLAETSGRTTADGDDTVGALLADNGHRRLRDAYRRMHGRAGEISGQGGAEQGTETFTRIRLLRRRQHQRPLGAEPLDLRSNLLDRAATEADPRRQGLIGEGLDHRRLLCG